MASQSPKTILIKHILKCNKKLFQLNKNNYHAINKIVDEMLNQLSPDDAKLVLSNPHIAQNAFLTNILPIGYIQSNIKYTRTMGDNLNRLPYVNLSKQIHTNLHKGQYKLLFSEIEFLTNYGNKSTHVIYIGAAPGYHIPCLLSMFKNHIFYLYDPAFTYTKHLQEYLDRKRVFLYSKFFTEETILEFKQMHNIDTKNTLFISDIRTTINQSNIESMNKTIIENMNLQKNIVKLLNPLVSMLKFRLPWTDENFEYFDGIRYFGVYAKWESTETRLVVLNPNSKKIYNGKKNEEELFYFNMVQRPALYKHIKVLNPRLDHCYDCTSEIYILQNYIKQCFLTHFNHEKYANIRANINSMISFIETQTRDMYNTSSNLFIK
jgi:hypothetical protein